MTYRARALAAVAVVLAGLLGSGCSSSAGGPSRADSRAFTLHELQHPAVRISLASYPGQPVIVSFFASWCPACLAEAQTVASYYLFRQGHHRHVTIIGIDPSDGRAAALSLLRQANVTFPVATDSTMATATAFGTPGLPATFFLNAQHHVVRRILGPVSWQQLSAGVAEMTGTPASPAASPSP